MINQSLLLTALVAGGSHCIGMCGGIATILSFQQNSSEKIEIEGLAKSVGFNQSYKKVIPIIELLNVHKNKFSVPNSGLATLLLHTGRIFLYMLAGAFVGGFGAVGLLFKSVLPVQTYLYYFGSFSLIFIGFRCLGLTRSSFFDGNSVIKICIEKYRNIVLPFSIWVSSIKLPKNSFIRGVLWGCLPCGLIYGVLPIALSSGSPWSGAILMLCFGLGALPYLLFAQVLAQQFGKNSGPRWLAVGAALILISLGTLGIVLPNEHYDAGWWC